MKQSNLPAEGIFSSSTNKSEFFGAKPTKSTAVGSHAGILIVKNIFLLRQSLRNQCYFKLFIYCGYSWQCSRVLVEVLCYGCNDRMDAYGRYKNELCQQCWQIQY